MDICDDFLTSLPLEPGMLLSDRMDFVIDDMTSSSSSTGDLMDRDCYMTGENQYRNGVQSAVKEEPFYLSSSSSIDSIDLDYFNEAFKTVNPDDFLNDMFKSEIKSEMSNSPSRDTPSPSNSGGSSPDPNEFRIEIPMSSTDDTYTGAPMKTFTFETPPISPPSPDSSSSSSSYPMIHTIQQQPVPVNRLITTCGNSSKLNILQGTLIPISTVPISMTTVAPISSSPNCKKIKIQPKPLFSGTGIKKPAQSKTIILSADDYSALMQKCKLQQINADGKPFILKAATPITSHQVAAVKSEASTTVNIVNGRVLKAAAPSTTTSPASTTMTTATLSMTLPTAKPHQVNVQPSTTDGRLLMPPRPLSVSGAAVLPSSCAAISKPPLVRSLLKQEIDEKILKKHQRMIKNRESACMSRKKKKDYVTSLENQLAALNEENEKLKSENISLRDRITQLDSFVCKCGKSLNQQFSTMLNPSNKKNAVFLLAMVFMVSMNIGPLGNLFASQMRAQTLKEQPVQLHHSRGLLWIDDDVSGSNATNRSNISNFYNDSSTSSSTADGNEPNIYPTCPLYVNQTESVRLASELRRWIGELPEYYNISAKEAQQNNFDLNTISNYLFNDDTIKSLFHQIKNVKHYLNKESRARAKRTEKQLERPDDKGVATKDNTNKIQVYNPDNHHALKYAELFEELRRQDDTFYVVSFSGDHLLLPALAHNKTFRPKMSLMLPSVGGLNGTYSSEYITLMQIDCEVVNTSLIQIKEKLIPKHLRSKATGGNSTTARSNNQTGRRAQTTDKINPPDYNHSENGSDPIVPDKEFNKHYKPYFVDKTFERRKLNASP